MNIDGIPTRTLRAHPERGAIDIIDQTRLPHALHWLRVATLAEAAHAIRAMQVRGAPLIGATAAYGLAIGLGERADDAGLQEAFDTLWATRPTAVNLHWALARMHGLLAPLAQAERCAAAWREAAAIAEEDVAQNLAIGQHGLGLLRQIARRQSSALNIMTHCNAGWLATVDWGTALSPVYVAHDAGLPVHVWVSETRPRNQGLLTAWELAQHGVPHTVIADNAAGLLLRQGRIDAVIVGADRIAANGDVANKVGTYLKALACADNGVPFYVAAPRSTLDFDLPEGRHIKIEERDGDEFRLVHGLDARGVPSALHQLPAGEAVANPAFDVTPARLVTAIITERGVCPAGRDGLLGLYPEEAHG
ncbi:S-methyl-5-thioribose-1-phosphate isomerase [Dechloromonas denitrificans]|uniref:S-methyl-5-thioribose-1-phosphate isomerase n=1 Tax=Dechloromonas denitrificans TaxID=281362 RepID=UPI001CFB8B8A|nr:S-methyl-5-thioribose-1-phosphate isomerase [Dechloromonas denitrificans]UCV09077.1 S-methyl-5-thioribose-1-phosphate isomerase [Dechloromonas denitrificans]